MHRSTVRPRGYKTFFILNPAEHEILNAHKYEHIKKFKVSSGSEKYRMLFFLLIYEQEKFHAQLSWA